MVNFGFDSWSRFWKRNQTLFYLLASMEEVRSGLFINPCLWLGDLVRSPARTLQRMLGSSHGSAVPRNIRVTTPLRLPLSGRIAPLASVNRRLNRQHILRQTGKNGIVILNNLQADRELVAAARQNAALTIFDWSDDFVEFSANPREREICRERCEEYCRVSDVILTINDDLRERAARLNRNAHVIRNATNFFTFQPTIDSGAVTRRIRSLGPIVVGYAGWLNSLRLDHELIRFIAAARPGWQFVFMGPSSEQAPLGEEIPRMKNVHILPPVTYPDYPVCLAALDACLLPNLINAHTNGNDPIKIYDYLASGRPVVATRTAGTAPFSELLHLADTKKQFLELLDRAVGEKSGPAAERRVDAGRRHSWDVRFDEVREILRDHLPWMM